MKMVTASDSTFGSSKTYSHEFYAYIEDNYNITKRFSANVGFAFFQTYWYRIFITKVYNQRAALNYIVTENSSVKTIL